MENEYTEEVSVFIRAVMPDATVEEWREAERNLDRFLDVVDAIVTRRRHRRIELSHDNDDGVATMS